MSGSPGDSRSFAENNLCPTFPQLFQKPVIFHTLLKKKKKKNNCRPLESYAFSFNSFSYCSPWDFTKLTHAPWLYKAMYLVSLACATGLFGGKKPVTVLSITVATAAIRYSSEAPEQVEIKSW